MGYFLMVFLLIPLFVSASNENETNRISLGIAFSPERIYKIAGFEGPNPEQTKITKNISFAYGLSGNIQLGKKLYLEVQAQYLRKDYNKRFTEINSIRTVEMKTSGMSFPFLLNLKNEEKNVFFQAIAGLRNDFVFETTSEFKSNNMSILRKGILLQTHAVLGAGVGLKHNDIFTANVIPVFSYRLLNDEPFSKFGSYGLTFSVQSRIK
jgi:hypothetical protein